MRRPLVVVTLAAWLAAAAAGAAVRQTATVGMALRSARALYPEARPVTAPETGAVTLELSDVDFAQTRWRTVDLVFSADGRLDRVQLVTRGESFDHLRARLRHDTDVFLAGPTPARLIGGPETLEMKICDFGADGVSLTYERITDPV